MASYRIVMSFPSVYETLKCLYSQEKDILRKKGDDLKVYYANYRNLEGEIEKRIFRVGDGSIIVRFDKTPFPIGLNDVVCPHFLELKWATGCPYACAWCYLQGTLRFLDFKTKPQPKDFDRIEKHLIALFNENGNSMPEILNSGELSDSMITEHTKNPFSRFVMNLFGTQDKHRLLFVTKSHEIDNLLKIENLEQAIISFSINAEKVAKRWERAPAIKQRIEAAGQAKDVGMEVRIRIDPMVPIEGWKKEYSELLDLLFRRLTPDRITLGSLRGLQSTINNARDKSWIKYLNERSNWGMKIAIETRKEMYAHMIDYLLSNLKFKGDIALCKETVQMWELLNRDYKRIRCNCTI